ncbi:MAG: DNA polymerase I [Fluviicola sp.]|nr:DNA polymerase I [Fluviicola sp.]
MLTPKHDKKLFLLDAYALIYRAYFAFAKNPRINSKGQNTSAAFGFTNALIDIIKTEEPTHIAVVFDPPGGATHRQEDFEAYKAHREEMPEDIRSMIEPIKTIIQAFNIPIVQVEGFEADDVIGTLAKIWGDAADNIPGIPGIGEKTSKILIQKYGSVENLIANADELKGKQKENVINFAEQGIVSKMLATIIIDVEVDFIEDELIICPPDAEKIKEIFTELEFRNIARRVIGEDIVVTASVDDKGQMDLFGTQSLVVEQNPVETADYKTIATEKPSYHLITQPEERKELLEILLKQPQVCFDTETNSINSLHADLVGMSFSCKAREGFYVAVPNNFEDAKSIVEEFRPFFESTTIEKIAHNIKYDLQVLGRYGIEIAAPIFDTMIAHYLINPEAKQSMDFLSEFYLSYKPISITDLIGKKGKNQGNMQDLKPEEVSDYACEDADITFQLKQIFEPEIQKEHLKHLFYEMEMPLVYVLNEMEKNGIAIDSVGLHEFSIYLEKHTAELEQSIKGIAEVDFNIDSPKQLGEVLFEKMKISSKAKKTKTGQYATGEDVLIKHEKDHPIIPMILEYRQLRKLKSTYVDPLPTLCDKVDGRIHTSFMQTVTATGRLSSNNPNLQNIPIRSENGKEIRKAFVARGEDFLLMSVDYSQIELRIIAALSNDPNMVEAFRSGHDIHTATAAKVFHISPEEVTRDQRSAAKAVNFGIIYGQSAFGLSQTLNISRTEAKEIIDSYYAQYGTIKTYMDETVAKARENGYVETIMKRRRYLPDINSSNAIVRGFAERNSINAPIQGSAADIIKMAMVAVYQEMKKTNLRSKMILQVHDELVFDVHVNEIEQMKSLVKNAMENAVQLAVPMEVEMELAKNWLEAH